MRLSYSVLIVLCAIASAAPTPTQQGKPDITVRSPQAGSLTTTVPGFGTIIITPDPPTTADDDPFAEDEDNAGTADETETNEEDVNENEIDEDV